MESCAWLISFSLIDGTSGRVSGNLSQSLQPLGNVPYILIATFTMLNLFIAVIVNSMQAATHAELGKLGEDAHDERENIFAEVRSLQAEIRELRKVLEGAPKGPTSIA